MRNETEPNRENPEPFQPYLYYVITSEIGESLKVQMPRWQK